MLAFSDPRAARTVMQGGALCIGNFDGVHRGHLALIARARACAGPRRPVGVLTFSPHPVRVLAPHVAPHLLFTPREKRLALSRAGVDVLIELPFDARLAAMPAADFVSQILVDAIGAHDVVVGFDFTYGQGRAGSVDTLRRDLALHGAELHVVTAVKEGELVCSSSRIRAFLQEGRVEVANTLLGRPYTIDGPVQRGDGRGQGLGFPTANIATDREVLPKLGVYAGRLIAADGVSRDAVVNIGLRPTFAGAGVRVEAHILDWSGNLYDQDVSLALVERLRDEMKFPHVDALKSQILQDIETARAALATSA